MGRSAGGLRRAGPGLAHALSSLGCLLIYNFLGSIAPWPCPHMPLVVT